MRNPLKKRTKKRDLNKTKRKLLQHTKLKKKVRKKVRNLTISNGENTLLKNILYKIRNHEQYHLQDKDLDTMIGLMNEVMGRR